VTQKRMLYTNVEAGGNDTREGLPLDLDGKKLQHIFNHLCVDDTMHTSKPQMKRVERRVLATSTRTQLTMVSVTQ
jgi:hypothetical protein